MGSNSKLFLCFDGCILLALMIVPTSLGCIQIVQIYFKSPIYKDRMVKQLSHMHLRIL